jgi:hypothetical protein
MAHRLQNASFRTPESRRPIASSAYILHDQRAMAVGGALFRPPLPPRERGALNNRVVSIDEHMTDFAVRPHSLDAGGDRQ